jgi:hypothetical protein
MTFSTCLRLCIASAAFMLTLPAAATSHQPAKGPSKGKQTVAGTTVAANKPVSMPLASAAPMAAPATADAYVAPQTITLTGVVVLANGQPCPGASVYMTGAARQLVVTDAHGAFALPVPAGNSLAINAEYFGVGSTRVALDKPSTEPMRITIR